MAKYGLRIRDKEGKITFDSSMRFPKYRGSIYTGDQDGAQVVPDMNAEIWFVAIYDQTLAQSAVKIPPTITVKDNVISWKFSNTKSKAVATIYYGIY